MKPTSNSQHNNDQSQVFGLETEQPTIFSTRLDWLERADLRLILKTASQSPDFNKQERDLALRLLAELDQIPLEL